MKNGILFAPVRTALALVVLAALRLYAADPAAPARGQYEPPAGYRLLIIGQMTNEVVDYAEKTGTRPAGFMTYTGIGDLIGLDVPKPPHSGGVSGRFYLDRYPDTVIQVGLWMVGSLQDIAQGNYDENIDKMADWIRSAKRPVFLRIGYEFDWDQNNYDPGDYIRAYRYMVDRIRSRGVRNVAYVWHSFGKVREIPLSAWYPGDDYVDWCAITYFDQGRVEMKRMVNFAKLKNKPLMLAETTPYGIGVEGGEKAWSRWFQPLFRFIRDYDVKALCYINQDWEQVPEFQGQGWGNSRVQDNPVVFRNWMDEVRKPEYLYGGSDLYSRIGFDPIRGY